MDYERSEKRRTKKDLKKKREKRAYKRGGKFRSMNVEESPKKEEK